jgi:hypothetical protein
MSLNPQGEGKNLYDVLEGSVSSYFSRLAGVLQRNESVNGEYKTTVSPSYGGNTPVAIPNFTRVCISTNGSTIVDLANSFITMELEYKLQFTKKIDAPAHTVGADTRVLFVGFKNSLEALSRYEIYVNSTKIHGQSWVGHESFIYNAGLAQSIRERNPYVYTTWKNAQAMSHDVCGVYIKLDKEYDPFKPTTVTIPVKINLHQILMLSSVRYLPSFCGRWEIELYPNWNNLIVLPIPLENTTNPLIETYLDDIRAASESFTQIGKTFQMLDYIKTGTVPGLNEEEEDVGATVEQATFIDQEMFCAEGRLTQCLMNTTTFQLRFEVYEGLRQMYAQQPLIIPTNILNYGRFSGEPGGSLAFHATLSQSLENCDSIFFLVPFENGQTTCFYQPYLTDLRLSLDQFGTRPQRYVRTWDDPRFLAMVLDSLNLETSEITAMNEDVARSLNTQRKYFLLGDNTEWQQMGDKVKGDKSNFFIGFSLSQVGFQSGTVSSPNTNINMIFDALLDRMKPHDKTPAINTSVIVMFLIDAALMIQVVQDSDVPIVKLTTKSIV